MLTRPQPPTPDSLTDVAESLRREKMLSSQLFQYAGRWVAVVDYAVERDAETLDELVDGLDEAQQAAAEILCVGDHSDAIHLY